MTYTYYIKFMAVRLKKMSMNQKDRLPITCPQANISGLLKPILSHNSQ